MHRYRIPFLLASPLITFLLVLWAGKPSNSQIAVQAQINVSPEVIFSIPIGDDGLHYAGVGVPDMLTWGPAAFTVASDGSFWFSDTADSRILHYSSNGELLGKIDLDELVVGATDIVAADSGLFVLDEASMPPKVLYLSLEGALLESHELPDGLHLEDGLTGIGVGENGELLVEREAGNHVTQFLDAQGKPAETITIDGYTHNGKLFTAKPDGLASLTPKQGTIIAGGLQIEVETDYDLGGLRILGFGPEDDFYVLLEELALNPETGLQVDQTIRHYDASGKYLGVARAPMAEQFTYVQQGIAIGPDSAVYALATYPDRIDVLRLNFTPDLDLILSNTSIPGGIKDESDDIETCVYRNTIMNRAASYINNSKYLSSTNTDGACTGRTKPHYIGGAGTYSSVPCDWGGGDSVSAYNGFMDPNTYKAGDINTAAPETCSRGVDCSGFVSVTWGISRRGTCKIDDSDISIPLDSVDELKKGDIMNNCNVHTVLYSSFGGDQGINDYESTIINNYDRVVYRYSTWGQLSGFFPYRYRNLCDP